MQTFLHLWNAYSVCYAIGYMLLVRPIIQKKNLTTDQKKCIDYLFYASLLVFSTIKLFNS